MLKLKWLGLGLEKNALRHHPDMHTGYTLLQAEFCITLVKSLGLKQHYATFAE